MEHLVLILAGELVSQPLVDSCELRHTVNVLVFLDTALRG